MVDALTAGDTPFATKTYSIKGNHLVVQGSHPATIIHQTQGVSTMDSFGTYAESFLQMNQVESEGFFAETFGGLMESSLLVTNVMGGLLGAGGPAEQNLLTSFTGQSLSSQLKQVRASHHTMHQ
jgi:hypothetical protein